MTSPRFLRFALSRKVQAPIHCQGPGFPMTLLSFSASQFSPQWIAFGFFLTKKAISTILYFQKSRLLIIHVNSFSRNLYQLHTPEQRASIFSLSGSDPRMIRMNRVDMIRTFQDASLALTVGMEVVYDLCNIAHL